VQHAPMTWNPIGYSVDQLFTVSSAVKGHERLHSFTYNQGRRIFIPRFSKKFELSPRETYHAPPLERINSSTAFAAFSNGGAAAIIITQNTTASQAKC
jgi:hypothetical protein